MSMKSTRNRIGRTVWQAACALGICVALAACGSAAAQVQPTVAVPAAQTQPTAVPSAAPTVLPAMAETQPAAADSGTPQDQSGAGPAVTLEIGTAAGANDFSYDKTTLEAPAGSQITLNFTNNTDLKDEVGHNWVLVKPGQEASVLADAQAAGDANDWLQDGDPGIIAHTALIEGGSSDSITFDAPAPGTYTFLSTFPKQYDGGMKGTLVIK